MLFTATGCLRISAVDSCLLNKSRALSDWKRVNFSGWTLKLVSRICAPSAHVSCHVTTCSNNSTSQLFDTTFMATEQGVLGCMSVLHLVYELPVFEPINHLLYVPPVLTFILRIAFMNSTRLSEQAAVSFLCSVNRLAFNRNGLFALYLYEFFANRWGFPLFSPVL